MTKQRIRIFVSSPSDVELERQVALQVIHRLGLQFRNAVDLKPVLWERQPLLASGHFQDALDPGSADIMVCILWGRLGSPLPSDFKAPNGRSPLTGTEWEFEHALAAFEQQGKPLVIVYRKTTAMTGSFEDEERAEQLLKSKRAVQQFFDLHFHNTDEARTYKRAHFPFDLTDEFEQLLETHLAELINELLEQQPVETAETISWFSGSPFRGLSAFDLEHRDIFFGRTQAIGEAIALFRQQVARERSFMMILGMSGSGKSSLVNAGLLPLILTPRVIQHEIGLVRHVSTRPSQWTQAPTPFQGLAESLIEALPELATIGQTAETLEELALNSPKSFEAVLGTAISQAEANENLHEGVTLRPLIVLDQAEELFTDRRFTDHQLAQLSEALYQLMATGCVWFLGSLRSDFLPNCEQTPELMDLMREQGQYLLLPPKEAELDQIIRQPARAAGLTYEIDQATGIGLDAVLREATSHQPGVLPLLEFALDELFNRHDTESRVLTHDSYRQIGGLEGAIGQRADAVCENLKDQMNLDRVLPKVLNALITISLDEQDTPTARCVPRDLLASDTDACRLIEALIEARLLISDGDANNAQLRVAHEALIREWQRARDWKADNIEFLRWYARVEREARLWGKEAKSTARLLQKGKPLAEAEGWLDIRDADVGHVVRDFVQASTAVASRREEEAREQRNTLLITQSLFLSGLAQQESDKGFHDRAMLLALNGLPGIHGGERPRVAQVEAGLVSALLALRKMATLAHGDWVIHAEFNADGTSLVTTSEDQTAAIWDARSGERLATLNHKGRVQNAAFSADGTRVVTASLDKTAVVWDARSGKRLLTLSHGEWVRHATFSADGTRIVTASDEKNAVVWDAQSGERLVTLNHENWVYSAAFNTDGTRVVTASQDKTAAVWDARSGKRLASLVHEKIVLHVGFSADGTRILTASEDNTAGTWDVRSGERRLTLVHEGRVFHAAFSTDGTQVVTASEDNTAAIWDAQSGERRSTLAHKGRVFHSAFSADGTQVVTASEDNTAAIWDANSGEFLATFAHEGGVGYAEFSTDSKQLVTVSRDRTAAIWEVRCGDRLATLSHVHHVLHVAFSADGTRVVTASEDSTAVIWDSESGERLATLAHQDQVQVAAFSADDSMVLTGAKDNTAGIWNARSGECLATLVHEDRVQTAVFNPDGTRVATASEDNVAVIWDVRTGERLVTLAHEDRIQSVVFSSDGKLVVTSVNNSAEIWIARSGDRKQCMAHRRRIWHAAISNDGTRVATASEDNTAAIWDARSGKRLVTLVHEGWVQYVTFSSDGERVVTASRDHTAVIWDARTGDRLATLDHDGWVWHATFSTDGTRVVTASLDQTAAVWDVRTGARLATMAHEGWVQHAAFNRTGNRVVTASWDGTAAIWDAPPSVESILADPFGYLPKNRTCLTSEERQQYFLPELTDNQRIERRCPNSMKADS